MDLMKKLTILADSAKYDAACTSSGADRPSAKGGIGTTMMAGCCHSFSADGRCITLLKILYTNHCVFDCKYCVNRSSNDVERAAFEPRELADLTIQFYRRNYIEGLFLSSGVMGSPDTTMERMIEALRILRYEHNFWGYIHAKTIPGASPGLVYRLGLLADRLSVNIELPSERSLRELAPHKTKKAILSPMRQIAEGMTANKQELSLFKHAPHFATAGQATQMMIGASPESDYQILRLASGLYDTYRLKRVFYSSYIPVIEDSLLPALDVKPPLLREHRLYQADFMLRQYSFQADEILDEDTPNFNPYLDPKCNWAINHIHWFPVDVNTADKDTLLRVPGIGPRSARRIVIARKTGRLGMAELKRIGVVLKRAQYFILTSDMPRGYRMDRTVILRALIDSRVFRMGIEQLSFFPPAEGRLALPGENDVKNMEEAVEGAISCLAHSLTG